MTTRPTRMAALTMAAALLVTGCQSTGDTEATPTVEATTPALEATEPAVEETPEAGPVPTEVGATVPADQVDAAREAGAAVYVSPNGDGTGVVIDPEAGTPQAVVEDFERADGTAAPSLEEYAEQMSTVSAIGQAGAAAGTYVFALIGAPSYGSDGSLVAAQYTVVAFGPEPLDVEAGGDFRRPTKEAAIAAARPFMDQVPDATLVDLTD